VTGTYELIVVGAGSGDTVLDSVPTSWRTAIVEPERFGITLHAVFSEPQIASAGLAKAQARDAGLEYLTAVQPFADAATGGRSRTTPDSSS
jgi:pyruvate/2-oxoglutarate dehydrogenase complex dihydrolipoamide dehydrogenase (E3) component